MSNTINKQGAKGAMNQMKMEIANELGIANYDSIDKGDLPSRVHGKIGGNMVKKLVESAEAQLAQK